MTAMQTLPRLDVATGELVLPLKYAENQHQGNGLAGIYRIRGKKPHPLALSQFELLEGSAPSGVGATDASRALHLITRIAAGFDWNFRKVPYTAVGVKHGNACGAGVATTPLEAAKKMVSGNTLSIFGGVIVTNFVITEEVAKVFKDYKHRLGELRRQFDGIYAPGFTPEAVAVLQRKNDRCRMMVNEALLDLGWESLDRTRQRVPLFGDEYLLQDRATYVIVPDDLTVYGPTLTQQQREDLVLGGAICGNTVSNTITLVRNGQLIGNGGGQQDRVGAAILAIRNVFRGHHLTRGAVAISDSFFPATDGPKQLIKAKVSVIYATSGSQMDQEVIDTCIAAGVTLVMVPDAEGRLFSCHIG